MIEKHGAISKQALDHARLVQIERGRETEKVYEIKGTTIIGGSEICNIFVYGIPSLRAIILQQEKNNYVLKRGRGPGYSVYINEQELEWDQLYSPLKDGDKIHFSGSSERIFVFKTK